MPTNFTYTQNIPLATNKPSVDQPNMKINTNSINSIIAVDHLSFGQATGILSDGYHKTIHQSQDTRTRSGVGATYANFPVGIVGVNQVVAASYTPDTTGAVADTQLFSVTGLGVTSQLTANLTNDPREGWCWCGGILIQWGEVSSAAGGGTVTFKDRVAGAIPFPNACFNVQATTSYNNTGTSSVNISIRKTAGSPSTTDFEWTRSGTTTGTFNGFYWMAIGN